MLLWQLFHDFVLYTAPALSMVSMMLIYLQMFLSAISPLKMIITAAKRADILESILLSLVPAIIVVSIAICEPLLFGSFLGEGFQDTARLARFLDQPAFFQEAIITGLLYIACTGLYLLCNRQPGRASAVSLTLSVIPECAALLAIFFLSFDQFFQHGQWLQSIDGFWLKCFLYGVFMLIYKILLYLISLLWRFLFSERPHALSQEAYWNAETRVWAYLNKSSRAIGIGFLMFAAFFAVVCLRTLYVENGINQLFLLLVLLGAFIAAAGLYFLLTSFWPTLRPHCRRMLRWGEPEQIMQAICQEVLDQPPLLSDRLALVTPHFLVTHWPTRAIYYLPLLQGSQTIGSGLNQSQTLYFADGSKCRLDMTSPQGRQIAHYLQGYRTPVA